MTVSKKDKQIADKIVQMLIDAGYDYDGMIHVLRMAQRQFLNMKLRELALKN